MAGSRIKLTTGWKKLSKMIDPKKFIAAGPTIMRKANGVAGLYAVRAIRQEIKNGAYAPNAPLTIAIKGSSKPLVDTGNLFKAITHKMVDDYTVWVGVLFTSGSYNLSVALHEGATIKVTEKMRNLFELLFRASKGKLSPSKLTGRAAEIWERARTKEFFPLRKSTSQIVIPPRPFMRRAIESSDLQLRVQGIWFEAIAKAMGVK
jgi:hypothetical protein